MNPYTGTVFTFMDKADPPMPGATIPADVALQEGYIDFSEITEAEETELHEMADKRQKLVAIEAEAAQRLRLGDRELRRRKQRRR